MPGLAEADHDCDQDGCGGYRWEHGRDVPECARANHLPHPQGEQQQADRHAAASRSTQRAIAAAYRRYWPADPAGAEQRDRQQQLQAQIANADHCRVAEGRVGRTDPPGRGTGRRAPDISRRPPLSSPP
ncbi:hypothetical protein GCM10027569_25450 [Flindersiella endophytica]